MPNNTARRVGMRTELIGVLAAVSLACIGLLHVLFTPRVHFLYDYGDSMVGPILYNALHSGDLFSWYTSPTLFIPEMAQYLAVTAIVPDAHWAVAITGVMNFVGIYLATRLLVNVGVPAVSRRGQVALAVTGLALFVGFGFLEVGSTGFAVLGHALQMFTLSYTLPHYSATLIATLLTVALAGLWLRPQSRAWRAWVGAALVLTVGVTVTSNPLFIVWALVPVAVAFAWALIRNITDRPLLWRMLSFGVLAVAAAGLGMFGRKLLAQWIVTDGASYIHRHYEVETLKGYWHQIQAFASTPLGFAEAVLYAILFVLIAVVTVLGLRERAPHRVLLTVYVGATALMTTVGTVLVGQAAPRYSLPALTFITVMLPVFAWWWIPSVRRMPISERAWRQASRVIAVVTVAIVVVTGIAVSNQRSEGAECLQSWIDEQDSAEPLVGAGGFWTSRRLAAYLPEQTILQVYSNMPLLWQNNGGSYLGRDRIDYVVVAPQDDAGAEIPDHAEVFRSNFGEPASITQCTDFEIWDYRGTPGQALLSQAILGGFAAH